MVDPALVDPAIDVLFAVAFALIAYGLGVLDRLGSLLAGVLAILILQTVGFVYLALLLAFVALGFAVTKLFWKRKEKLGVAEAKSGTRGWRNVAANGGVPAIIAAMTLLGFSREEVALGFLAAIATASADTFASELGVLSSRVYLITMPWKRVPAGTNGGVSNWGHLVALGGATIASVVGVLLLRIPFERVWIPVVAGWIGCQIDSVLGALFEEERGRAYGFLSKSDVNFFSILLSSFGVLLFLRV
jgi:uncharacterized protein (TIGR00297 family)